MSKGETLPNRLDAVKKAWEKIDGDDGEDDVVINVGELIGSDARQSSLSVRGMASVVSSYFTYVPGGRGKTRDPIKRD